MELFIDLLARWSAKLNLLGPADLAEIWVRHVQDSAQLAPLIPPGTRSIIDFGSGAGFPGLIVALISGIPTTLIDSDRRKAAFLREAVRVTTAPCTVVARRVETVVCQADLMTARAVAPLGRLLSFAYPLLHPGGRCLFLKGETVDEEVAIAQRDWAFDVRLIPSVTDPAARIVEISALRRR